jgi:hypothetical protein
LRGPAEGRRVLDRDRITGCAGARPLRHDLAVEFLIMNERPWRSIVLHHLSEGEVHLLCVLFPHLAGLDLSQVHDRDHAAVLNGLTLPYSSGAVEGKVCKIKFLKRLMFGRASFDLLRKMALWSGPTDHPT